jgi:hypothetical protein
MYEVDVMKYNLKASRDEVMESHTREDKTSFIRLVTILLNNLPSDYTLCISQD